MKVYASPALTASGQVGQSNAVYYGYTVTVLTAVAAVNIRKGSLTGQIIDVIPVGTTAGTSKDRSLGVQCDGGIFLDLNGGSGTFVIFYE